MDTVITPAATTSALSPLTEARKNTFCLAQATLAIDRLGANDVEPEVFSLLAIGADLFLKKRQTFLLDQVQLASSGKTCDSDGALKASSLKYQR